MEVKREEIIETVVREIQADFKTKVEGDGFSEYTVGIHDFTFHTYMTNKELEDSVHCAIDILEECKNCVFFIENKESVIKEIEDLVKEEKSEQTSEGVMRHFLHMMELYDRLTTDKLKTLVDETETTRRVGGAYKMLVSHPEFAGSIVSVIGMLLGQKELDEELYIFTIYFITRYIMKINSTN